MRVTERKIDLRHLAAVALFLHRPNVRAELSSW